MFSQDLNLRQRKWLELLKDYDVSVLYHLGKANIIANALSSVSMDSAAHIENGRKELVKDVHQLVWLGVRLSDSHLDSQGYIPPILIIM